jgi:hypothetical protein
MGRFFCGEKNNTTMGRCIIPTRPGPNHGGLYPSNQCPVSGLGGVARCTTLPSAHVPVSEPTRGHVCEQGRAGQGVQNVQPGPGQTKQLNRVHDLWSRFSNRTQNHAVLSAGLLLLLQVLRGFACFGATHGRVAGCCWRGTDHSTPC